MTAILLLEPVYAKTRANPFIGTLLRLVKLSDDSTINLHESNQEIRNALNASSVNYDPVNKEAMNDARLQLVSTLNAIYYIRNELPSEWWYDNELRVRKMLVVSIVWEGVNLASFTGFKGFAKDDVPVALGGLWVHIHSIQFSSMIKAQKTHYQLNVMGNLDVWQLYSNQFTAKQAYLLPVYPVQSTL